jgi:hypothetical protein
MTYTDSLISQAARYWNRGEYLPIDLFAEMLGMGLDVEALERNYMKDPA